VQEERVDVIRLPGVSAEDAVTTVRVHLDRVHDVVRRLGCGEAAAVEVVETSAMDLVEALADAPDTVADRVGWWFARARSLALRVGGDDDGELPVGSGLLSVDEDQGVLAEALEALPERDRAALLLRDSYDLSSASVSAALGTDPASAMELVARARLAFLRVADGEPSPAVPEHQNTLGALARVAEGGPVAPPDATPRRHAMSCEACRSVVQAQQRAHLLLSGSPWSRSPRPTARPCSAASSRWRTACCRRRSRCWSWRTSSRSRTTGGCCRPSSSCSDCCSRPPSGSASGSC
jgi:hypothetical protein